MGMNGNIQDSELFCLCYTVQQFYKRTGRTNPILKYNVFGNDYYGALTDTDYFIKTQNKDEYIINPKYNKYIKQLNAINIYRNNTKYEILPHKFLKEYDIFKQYNQMIYEQIYQIHRICKVVNFYSVVFNYFYIDDGFNSYYRIQQFYQNHHDDFTDRLEQESMQYNMNLKYENGKLYDGDKVFSDIDLKQKFPRYGFLYTIYNQNHQEQLYDLLNQYELSVNKYGTTLKKHFKNKHLTCWCVFEDSMDFHSYVRLGDSLDDFRNTAKSDLSIYLTGDYCYLLDFNKYPHLPYSERKNIKEKQNYIINVGQYIETLIYKDNLSLFDTIYLIFEKGQLNDFLNNDVKLNNQVDEDYVIYYNTLQMFTKYPYKIYYYDNPCDVYWIDGQSLQSLKNKVKVFIDYLYNNQQQLQQYLIQKANKIVEIYGYGIHGGNAIRQQKQIKLVQQNNVNKLVQQELKQWKMDYDKLCNFSDSQKTPRNKINIMTKVHNYRYIY